MEIERIYDYAVNQRFENTGDGGQSLEAAQTSEVRGDVPNRTTHTP